jgi:hypothetical protein
VALAFDLLARPRHFSCLALLRPKPLPVENLGSKWEGLNQYEQWMSFKRATGRARHKLASRRRHTGVGILGKPIQALQIDPRFQGEYGASSVQAGEAVALSALSSEFLILDLAGVPRQQQHRYIGQSQYPRFKVLPLVRRSPKGLVYGDGEIGFWCELRNRLAAMSDMLWPPPLELRALILSLPSHVGLLHAKLTEDGQFRRFWSSFGVFWHDGFVFPDDPASLPPGFFLLLVEFVEFVQSSVMDMYVHALHNKFDLFARLQFAKGGGSLFKYITRGDALPPDGSGSLGAGGWPGAGSGPASSSLSRRPSGVVSGGPLVRWCLRRWFLLCLRIRLTICGRMVSRGTLLLSPSWVRCGTTRSMLPWASIIGARGSCLLFPMFVWVPWLMPGTLLIGALWFLIRSS